MSSEQIFILEALVNRIILQPHIAIENLDELCLRFKFAQIVNFDIDTTYFPLPEYDENNPRVIKMNFGKTFLFTSRPSTLRNLLETEPLEIGLYDGVKLCGSVTVPWKLEFSEMIKFFETIGMVKSCVIHELFPFTSDYDTKVADIDIFLKMSCFGENVQTLFQVRHFGKNQELIFRQGNKSETFKCERFEDERTEPLVAALYSGIADFGIVSDINVKQNVSLTALFENTIAATATPSTYNTSPPREDEGIDVDFVDKDVISISFRPPQNKFLDFINMVSADIKDQVKATVTIPRGQVARVRSFLRNLENQEKKKSDALQLTSESIASKLCGNKDCPGVRRFKKYGIGPLAPGSALGTLYEFVEPPVVYGLSHTYGTLCNYGPLGVFSKPKHEDEPFTPMKPPSSLKLNQSALLKTKCEHHCKHQKKVKTSKTWHSSTCPLRLRGGGGGDCPLTPISPMVECKSVMDKFDDILAAYRRALGPCGQAVCPYAQNISVETCKKSCVHTDAMPVQEIHFKTELPPTEVEPQENRYPAGCGSLKCAYAKYKIGLLDEDAQLELQFLPPALRSSCGDPKCKYPPTPELPPIHWDCPDPLPKDQCKNPNCPLLPKLLRKLQPKQMMKGPCGSSECSYAVPEPCDNPTCPFLQKACPMATEQAATKSKSEETTCTNPECPFASENINKTINDENDPKFKGEFETCGNPDCPYNNPVSEKGSRVEICNNPKCPFKKKSKMRQTVSRNGKKYKANNKFFNNFAWDCNKQKSKSSIDGSVCSNPQCPYNMKTKEDKSKNEDCSCEKEDKSICSNTECSEFKARPLKQSEQKSVCDDPYCPYGQPLPSCGIPNCQYELLSASFYCENPVCLVKKDKCRVNSASEEEKQVVVDTTAANASICDHVPCEDKPGEECENPDCGFTVEKPKRKCKRGRKKRSKFVYTIGDTYPGTKLGHRECITPSFMVPPNMGWLWNIRTPILNLKPRRGWRPGALTRIIAQRIRAHRQSKGLGMFALPSFKTEGAQYNELKLQPKPTLQIQKKEGCYWITMNPLKDPHSLSENENPYMECSPMTFKITKNNKSMDICCCSDEDMRKSVSSSSSELDIEFTPPAGIIHPERFKKKRDVACAECQYDPFDFEVQTKKDEKKSDKKSAGKKTQQAKKGRKK
ncbi:uncharacterized protein LOC132708157 [Cylas formicarius]|uniref:uncharacterized protein LOC132708157 n=1 Tax=Cylas formicarius TaxID=197179 RepID=UPI0029585A6F|nr:uncharacterized protein LOC132708157 [Cylas formicarius]